MSNIIKLNNYTKGKRKNKMKDDSTMNRKNTLDIIKERIRQTKSLRKKFSMKEIEDIAVSIRYAFMGDNRRDPTPIIKITENFGFSVFCTKLDPKHSGNIHIKDNKYNVENEFIIVVDKNENLFQQRFVVAHELGHYLFDYLGSDYEINAKAYTCPYLKNNHKGKEEKVANRFAAALLMPKEMFITEHDNAVDEDDRKLYVIRYLSELFQVKEESVLKRIDEVGEGKFNVESNKAQTQCVAEYT